MTGRRLPGGSPLQTPLNSPAYSPPLWLPSPAEAGKGIDLLDQLITNARVARKSRDWLKDQTSKAKRDVEEWPNWLKGPAEASGYPASGKADASQVGPAPVVLGERSLPTHLTIVVTETTCQTCGAHTRSPGNAFLAHYGTTSVAVCRDAKDLVRYGDCSPECETHVGASEGKPRQWHSPECEALPRSVSVRSMSVPFCEACWK